MLIKTFNINKQEYFQTRLKNNILNVQELIIFTYKQYFYYVIINKEYLYLILKKNVFISLIYKKNIFTDFT